MKGALNKLTKGQISLPLFTLNIDVQIYSLTSTQFKNHE